MMHPAEFVERFGPGSLEAWAMDFDQHVKPSVNYLQVVFGRKDQEPADGTTGARAEVPSSSEATGARTEARREPTASDAWISSGMAAVDLIEKAGIPYQSAREIMMSADKGSVTWRVFIRYWLAQAPAGLHTWKRTGAKPWKEIPEHGNAKYSRGQWACHVTVWLGRAQEDGRLGLPCCLQCGQTTGNWCDICKAPLRTVCEDAKESDNCNLCGNN